MKNEARGYKISLKTETITVVLPRAVLSLNLAVKGESLSSVSSILTLSIESRDNFNCILKNLADHAIDKHPIEAKNVISSLMSPIFSVLLY